MPDFYLIRRALIAVFGDTDDIYFVSEHLKSSIRMQPNVKIAKLRALVKKMLEQHDYNLEQNDIISFLKPHSPFLYGELFCLCDLITLELVMHLYRTRKKRDQKLLDTVCRSLRNLDSIDFELVLFNLSDAEKTFYEKSPAAFARSDSPTKGLYRQSCVHYARKKNISECSAAKLVAQKDDIYPRHPVLALMYYPTVFALCLVFSALVYAVSRAILPSIIALCPFFELSKRLLDSVLSMLLPAVPTARIKKECIDHDAYTLCVITTLLSGKERDGVLCEKLERYYLANRNAEYATFGILGDLFDSDTEASESDSDAIAFARDKIDELNRKYGDRFALFMRKRVFSESEQRYMGRERKRGAVCDLIALIGGDERDFNTVVMPSGLLYKTKYLITLDADTELSLNSLSSLVGAISHPAHKVAMKNGVVTKGCAIIQPHMSTKLDSANASPFAAITGGDHGRDIYSSAAFDLYQDLFSSGLFCGKGIIDVASFASLPDRLFDGESVLSHDALEGCYLSCRTASDITLSDSTPKNAISFYKRHHRWVRGDVQAVFHAKKPLSLFSRFKLYDNVRRALLGHYALLLCLISPFYKHRVLLLLAAISYILLPFIVTLFRARTTKMIAESAKSTLFELASLSHIASLSFDATFRAIYRVKISKRKMLEWVTASDSDKMKAGGILSYCRAMPFSLIFGALLLIISPTFLHFALGLSWLCFPFACYFLSKEKKKLAPSKRDIDTVRRYVKDMWRYFSDNVTEKDNFLPPDNVQISPHESIAHRTSPTNIGLYMLSVLSARDFSLITSDELFSRLKSTMDTVDSLAVCRGLLYNWYDTRTLDVIGAPFISSVDCGNFAVCLSAIAEGIKEYSHECDDLTNLSERIAQYLKKCDFAFLFNKKRSLFSIGYDASSEKIIESCYDIFCSESALLYYYASSRDILPYSDETRKKLRRIIVSAGRDRGILSWTGTMFEYFMPSILLPAKKGSAFYLSLDFCLKRQKKRSVCGMWGRSESGYYAFDGDMNYQYRAFGCSSLAQKRYYSRENVLSPYSSFLTLPHAPKSSLSNLSRMESFGMYGRYGFYESADFTPSRVGHGYAFIRSFMSHHIGMSITSAGNYCFDNIMIRRFLKNPLNRCAELILDERADYYTKAQKASKRPAVQRYARIKSDKKDKNVPLSTAMLSNNKARVVATSKGNICLYDGKYCLSRDCFEDDDIHSLRLSIKADDAIYEISSGNFSASDTAITLKIDEPGFHASASITLHGTRSCFCITLDAAGDFTEIAPLLYFEPVMAKKDDYNAHVAFSDLSLESSYDESLRTVIYHRRPRAINEQDLYMAVYMTGGLSSSDFECRRDRIFGQNYAKSDVISLAGNSFDGEKNGPCIIPVCAVTKNSISRSGRYHCEFLISFGYSKDSALKTIRALSAQKKPKRTDRSFERSLGPIVSAREALAYGTNGFENSPMTAASSLILNAIYLPRSNRRAITPPRDYLWAFGISGDFDIIALCLNDDCFDSSRLKSSTERLLASFITAHRYLTIAGIRFDLVISAFDADKYGAPNADAINHLISSLGCGDFFKKRGGIHTCDAEYEKLKIYSKLSATVDSKTVFAAIAEEQKKMDDGEKIVDVCEISRAIINPSGAKISDSFSFDNGDICISKGPQKMPWCNIYASRQFGCLVSQNSLGYTWFKNSREGRLTPWSNDILLGFSGERIIASVAGKQYDLCAISNSVVYRAGYAEWRGVCDGINYTVKCGIEKKLPLKMIVCRSDEKMSLCFELTADKNAKIMPVIKEIESGAYLLFANASERLYEHILKKFKSTNDIEKALDECSKSNEKELSSGIELSDVPEYLSVMFNHRLLPQTLFSRMYGRTAFYQSGGAYGFRDQLQDCLSVMYCQPNTSRTHIIRACFHQYEEGDVMHWWHWNTDCVGIRTKCSDDHVWLPYVTAEYLRLTGDDSLLNVQVRYLSSPPLDDNESERYEKPTRSDLKQDVYSHCVRALRCALSRIGNHGLPLMGKCDWNDGMSRVGENGGESVWLAFFIRLTIKKFIPICEMRGDIALIDYLAECERSLQKAIQKHAWDGEHYMRAFFGDGYPLGSKNNFECKIDALPQAFAAIVDGKNERSVSALESGYEKLYDHYAEIYKLFVPPFDRSERDVGYIKGYCPGLRENGGQYTHAAIWAAWGLLNIRENERGYGILRAMNPIYRSRSPRHSESYLVEPYYLAADIYSAQSHLGRGGWTIYTGAAAWYYKVVLEDLIGYKEDKDGFYLLPSLCNSFDQFTLKIDRHGTLYTVKCRSGEKNSFKLDGKIVNNRFIFDKRSHFLEITVEKNS